MVATVQPRTTTTYTPHFLFYVENSRAHRGSVYVATRFSLWVELNRGNSYRDPYDAPGVLTRGVDGEQSRSVDVPRSSASGVRTRASLLSTANKSTCCPLPVQKRATATRLPPATHSRTNTRPASIGLGEIVRVVLDSVVAHVVRTIAELVI